MHVIILVSRITLLLTVPDVVATQETAAASAPTETTTVAALTTVSESPNKTMYYGDVAGDRVVRTVFVEYVGGTAVPVFESDLPRTAIVTAPTDSTSTGTAVGSPACRPIPPGRATIRIDSPGPRVTPITSYSVENSRYVEIQFDNNGSTLITGPFTGTDMRGVAIGGVLGTSFGTFLIIVRRRFGLHRGMERVA